MGKIEELLVNKGLYEGVDIEVNDLDELNSLLNNSFLQEYRIDTFCVNCNEKRTFESVDKEVHEDHGFVSMISESIDKEQESSLDWRFQRFLNKRYCISFRCTRDTSHTLLFDFITTDSKLIKIGQYPS